MKPSAYPPWIGQCHEYIEDRGGPLDEPFTGVSETFLLSLEGGMVFQKSGECKAMNRPVGEQTLDLAAPHVPQLERSHHLH